MAEPPPQNARAPRRTPWWFRLVRAVLNLALLAVLALQLFALFILSTEKHLRLPDFAQQLIERRLQEQGLSVRFRSLEITLSGNLRLSGPQVYLEGTDEPVAEADYLAIEPDWLALMWGHRLAFSEAHLANATFYCPPEVSPTGVREPFVGNLSFDLTSQGRRWWEIEQLRARVFNTSLFAFGSMALPEAALTAAPGAPAGSGAGGPAASGAPGVAGPGGMAASLAAQYRKYARQIVEWEPQFARVKNPAVYLVLAGDQPGLTRIQVRAIADSAQPPADGLTVGPCRVGLAATWDGRTLRAVGPASVRIETVSYRPKTGPAWAQDFSSGVLWAQVRLASGPRGLLTSWPSRVALTLGSPRVGGVAFDGVGAEADVQGWPDVLFVAFASRGKDRARLAGSVNVAQRDAVADFSVQTEFTPELALAGVSLPPAMNSLRFDRAVRAHGQAVLAAGGRLKSLDFSLDTEGAHFERINLYAAHARGRIDFNAQGIVLDLPEISLWNATYRVDGAYFQDFRTQDFRLFARGNVDPSVLDPFLGGGWWMPVRRFLVPGAKWPEADVEYSGNWDGPPTDNPLFVYARLAGARAGGVAMDDIRLRVFQRYDVVEVFDLAAKDAAGGKVTGAMLWMMQPPYEHTYEQRFFFKSTLPLADAATLAGSEVVDLVRPLKCPTPPTVEVDQRTGDSANPQPGAVSTKVHVTMGAPFEAYHVPFESAEADVAIGDGISDIPRLDFRITGGQGHAQATITNQPQGGDELAFKVLVQGAQHGNFLNALGRFSTAEADAGGAAAAPAEAAKGTEASLLSDLSRSGLIDVALGGHLVLGDPDSFAANGQTRIYEAELGQLHLFGPMSRLLEDTKMPLGSFNLDEASSDLQIAHQYLRFPDLVITGPSARLVSAGTFHLGDGQLNFNALIFPLAQWKTPGLSEIVNAFDPLENTVTLTLHGTMEQPQWSLAMHPSRLFEDKRVEGPAIPGYAAMADGSPILPALPEAPPLPPPSASQPTDQTHPTNPTEPTVH